MEDKYIVIGIEHRSYVSKKTGKNVEGYNLYLSQEPDRPDPRVIGVRCFPQWISPDLYPADIAVGSVVFLTYNRFGRVASVSVVG